MKAREAKALRPLDLREKKLIRLQAFGWRSMKDDAALSALAVAAAIVVQVKPVAIENFEIKMPGVARDFAKTLDLDAAFL